MAAAFLRLIGLVISGYIIFHPQWMRRKLLPWLSAAIVNVLFPLYYISRYGISWDDAFSRGAHWMPLFFVMCVVTIYLQYLLVLWLLKHTRIFSSLQEENKSEFILLFAIHNVGYVPLPILEAIAPEPILIFLFTYVMAYQLIFWSFAVNIIKRVPGQALQMRFRLTIPFAGIATGIILAATGLYDYIPRFIASPVEQYSRLAMDGIMIVLGGILAGVPHESLTRHREFGPFLLVRQVIYPLLVLLAMLALRLLFGGPSLLPGEPMTMADTWRWMQLFLVIEAAVPPATNIMIAIQNYGRPEQLPYSGSGIILSYLGAAVSLPLFVVLGYYL
jgi:hypothetical protein